MLLQAGGEERAWEYWTLDLFQMGPISECKWALIDGVLALLRVCLVEDVKI